jgi:hypothetical protein
MVISKNFERVHQLITYNAISPSSIDYTPPSSSIPIGGFGFEQIVEIQNANKNVDFNQSNSALHFDDENFDGGITQLINLEDEILKQLQQPTVIDKTTATMVRKALGQFFHTLQDFFAHSSWVNIRQDVPKLWISSNATSLPATTIDPCPFEILDLNNAIFFPDTSTLSFNSFTSGYAYEPYQAAKAPDKKCAHGLLDKGIHKDWTGRDFHPEARAQAIYATAEATKYIINDPDNNPDNVCMLMTDNLCPVTTTVTVDTSGSTGNGTVTSDPSGINCTIGNSNGCSSEFETGMIIVLTATSDTNSTFQSWSGPNAANCQEGTAQATCTLNLIGQSINITATFVNANPFGNPFVGTWKAVNGKTFTIYADGTYSQAQDLFTLANYDETGCTFHSNILDSCTEYTYSITDSILWGWPSGVLTSDVYPLNISITADYTITSYTILNGVKTIQEQNTYPHISVLDITRYDCTESDIGTDCADYLFFYGDAARKFWQECPTIECNVLTRVK